MTPCFILALLLVPYEECYIWFRLNSKVSDSISYFFRHNERHRIEMDVLTEILIEGNSYRRKFLLKEILIEGNSYWRKCLFKEILIEGNSYWRKFSLKEILIEGNSYHAWCCLDSNTVDYFRCPQIILDSIVKSIISAKKSKI